MRSKVRLWWAKMARVWRDFCAHSWASLLIFVTFDLTPGCSFGNCHIKHTCQLHDVTCLVPLGMVHIEHTCQLHDVTCLVPLGMVHIEHTYQLHDVTCLVPVPVLGHRRSGSHGTTPIFVSTGPLPAPNPGMFGQSGLLPQILKLLLVSILYYRKMHKQNRAKNVALIPQILFHNYCFLLESNNLLFFCMYVQIKPFWMQ